MYTLMFGNQTHTISDDTANLVKKAILNKNLLVTIPIEIGTRVGVSFEYREIPFDVTLNVANIIALIEHKLIESLEVRPANTEPFRPDLMRSVVAVAGKTGT